MTYAAPPTDAEPGVEPKEGRSGFGCLFEVVETIVLTLVIYLVIHTFVAQPFEVQQNSMVATIQPSDYVLIDKLTPRFSDYQRGDIVVFTPPNQSSPDAIPFIKRIIGLPGDVVTLLNGRVYVTPPGGVQTLLNEGYVIIGADGRPSATQPKDAEGTAEWLVPEDEYFVMGDNRPESQDSRVFGSVERSSLIGRAWLRYFPLDRFTVFQRPTYEALSGYWRGGSTATIQLSIARS
jgi:signal peptidase I